MIQQHQVGRIGGGGGRDGRRGKEEWPGKGGDRVERRDNREREREKFDQNKVAGILSRRKAGMQVMSHQRSEDLFSNVSVVCAGFLGPQHFPQAHGLE